MVISAMDVDKSIVYSSSEVSEPKPNSGMEDNEQQKGRGRPKSFVRHDALELAMEHYWREGVHALSLNEVCRRISISKPAIYREFGGEDGFMEAVLGHYRDVVVAPVVDYLEVELPFAQIMEGLIIGMTTERTHPPGCLFTEMRLLRKHFGPKTEAKLEAIESERRAAFEKWYTHALERGEVNPTLSPIEAAKYIDAQFSMLLLHMGMGQDVDMVREHSRLAVRVLGTG